MDGQGSQSARRPVGGSGSSDSVETDKVSSDRFINPPHKSCLNLTVTGLSSVKQGCGVTVSNENSHSPLDTLEFIMRIWWDHRKPFLEVNP